jgi:predicted HTH domain antitoxin
MGDVQSVGLLEERRVVVVSAVSFDKVEREARSVEVKKEGRQLRDITGRDKRIQELYESGLSLEEIGKLMSLTRERVRQILDKRGVRRRTTRELAESARKKFLDEFSLQIDEAFENLRSVKLVEKKFSHLNVPCIWIREYLAPRRNEAVYWTTSSKRWEDTDLLELLRVASNGSGSLSAKRYLKWRKDNNFNGRRPPTHTAIGWRFDSWRNAVEKAGLKCVEANREYSRKWDAEDAFSAITAYVEECAKAGARPVFAGYEKWSQGDKNLRPSGAYVRFLTGLTWSQALAEVYRRRSCD